MIQNWLTVGVTLLDQKKVWLKYQNVFLFYNLGCLKAREEVLEIVKKKMEEVNATNTPMPKVKLTFYIFVWFL